MPAVPSIVLLTSGDRDIRRDHDAGQQRSLRRPHPQVRGGRRGPVGEDGGGQRDGHTPLHKGCPSPHDWQGMKITVTAENDLAKGLKHSGFHCSFWGFLLH